MSQNRRFLAPVCLGLLALSACGSKEVAQASQAPTPTVSTVATPVPVVVDAAAMMQAQETAQKAAQKLGVTLKMQLVTAMGEGGPVQAIGVCSAVANQIADEVSLQTGMMIGRTALRIRNPANTPDSWERQQLLRFSQALEAGADPKGLAYAEVITNGDQQEFRWMKPIILQKACVACHGKAISPEVQAQLTVLYPADKAVGFIPGELRGAFTARKILTVD